jgi:threonine aldolase
MSWIDLRSDTVTQPSSDMRHAMASAAVGDDVYGEDPSVRELEEATAELLGSPAALFVPSGTMANQLALLTQTRRGDEVVVGHGAHIAWHEAGAGAAWAGVQFAVAGTSGLFTAQDVENVLKPHAPHIPRSKLVCLENTHNLSGGRVFPTQATVDIQRLAKQRGLKLHLDGARLWHACVALNQTPSALVVAFDSVTVCFSKGLGAPVGSALVGDQVLIQEARRFRKMLGGGMRQAGIVAAGALYALKHHRQELALDHQKAQAMATILQDSGAALVTPETNIVMLSVAGSAEHLVDLAKSKGVLAHAMDPSSVRLVLHRDVSMESAELAAHQLVSCLREVRPKV